MTAIIKKNFRLQNARDFLDNFINHPRLGLGLVDSSDLNQPISLEDNLTDVSADSDTLIGSAKYPFSWRLSNSSIVSDVAKLRKDAILGLQKNIGAHVIDRNHYLFVGKTTPWKLENGSVDVLAELSPPIATDSLENERRIWDEMLGLKKINNLSASLVIPRIDWDSSGKTVYAQYDDTKELYLEPTDERKITLAAQNLRAGTFYVLTDQYDLFVCIENGNNSPSTQKPTRTNDPTNLIETIDGYVWKFITTIKSGDAVKFLTDSWIPIRTLVEDDGSQQWDVQQSATPGSVLSFVVDNPGENYNNVHLGKFADAPSTDSGVGVVTLTTITGGEPLQGTNNAYANAHLYIKDGDFAGDVYKINSYDSFSKKITLDSTWQSGRVPLVDTQYEILPIITVESNGTVSAKLKPVVAEGEIKRVIVTQAGENATFVKVTVADNTAGGGGGQAKAKIRAVISSGLGLGKDPEKDLNAFFVMMNARLQYNEGDGDFPISNDYRQLGIIRDVLDPNGQLAAADTLSAVKSMIVTLSDENKQVLPDQLITQTQSDGSVATAVAIEILDDPALGAPVLSRKISYIQTPETGYVPFSISSTLSVTDSAGTVGLITTLNREEVKKFSGEILYVENRRPILRAQDQLEDIKAIIEF